MITRRWLRITLALCTLWLMLACQPNLRSRTPIVVASADTPEQLLLGQMTMQMLRAAGYRVIDKTNLGNAGVVRAALKAGSVDLYWEYTGDAWTVHLGHDLPVANAQKAFERVRDEDALNQISWVALSPAQRTLGLVMRESQAKDLELYNLSGLARYVNVIHPGVRLCTPQELYHVSSAIRGLERVYNLRFDERSVRFTSIQEGYAALADGECDCALGFPGDAERSAHHLIFLEDDQEFFQASNLAAAVRTPVLQRLPLLEEPLTRLGQALTAETLADLQRQVVVERQEPAKVARRFLTERGLIGGGRGLFSR